MRTFSELQERIKCNNWSETELDTIPDKSRRNAITLFRLITEHDSLDEHLYRIGVHLYGTLISYMSCRICGLKEPMNRKYAQCCKTPPWN
ncbi:hypothetical protein CEXT_102971 [Caerostris extrusa]|uniref:Uncharacterized protein n=1 Tax=Caerostris extrusa TaxID=172846 RepID=A0AAV4X1F9_CAEEX|nr:hypothetical protein CEXT_102971 [Caerostris extrusa]